MAPMVAQEAPLVFLQLMEGEVCINNPINLRPQIVDVHFPPAVSLCNNLNNYPVGSVASRAVPVDAAAQ